MKTITESQRAICASFTHSYQFLEAKLLSHAAPLSAEARAVHQAQWAKLRAENAALRILTDDLRLSSAPLSYFDAALVKEIRPDFLKAARIIGTLLVPQWDAEIYNASDFFLGQRLLMLARAGVVEGKGDLRQIAFSEVRLPPAAEN